MELKVGRSVWELEDGAPRPFPPLEHDATCDVLVVGAGVTGALVAYELVKAGLECVVIDQREPAAGSTPASTALLVYDLDTPLHVLAQSIGERDAAACYQACLEAIGRIEGVVGEIGGGCDLIRRQSFHVAEQQEDVSSLQAEYEIRRKYGLKVDFLTGPEVSALFSFQRPGALLSHDAAEIDVVKFVRKLFAAATRRGARVHGKTDCAEVTPEGRGYRVQTSRGLQITARHVIFATGYESDRYLGRRLGEVKATYAIATNPLRSFPGWYERSLIWNTSKPYLYLRTTADGRAVIGGEDTDFQDNLSDEKLLRAKARKLESQLRAFFPELDFEIEAAWAGAFEETKDSLAYIGAAPNTPGLLFALGYGGNGIAYGMVAAEILRDACLGQPNAQSRLFRFDR